MAGCVLLWCCSVPGSRLAGCCAVRYAGGMRRIDLRMTEHLYNLIAADLAVKRLTEPNLTLQMYCRERLRPKRRRTVKLAASPGTLPALPEALVMPWE